MQELNKLVISNTQPLNGEPWLKPTKEGNYSLYICNNGYHLVDNTDEFNITVDTLIDLNTIPNNYDGKITLVSLKGPTKFLLNKQNLYISQALPNPGEPSIVYRYENILPNYWNIPYNLQPKDAEELYNINPIIDEVGLLFPPFLFLILDNVAYFVESEFNNFSGIITIAHSKIHCCGVYDQIDSKFIITKMDCMTPGNLHYAGDIINEQNVKSEFIFNDTSISPGSRMSHINGYLNSNINISSSLSKPWGYESPLANNKITVSTNKFHNQCSFTDINIGSNVVLQNFIITPQQSINGLNIADSSSITFGAINANISLENITLKGYLNIELSKITELANCTIENTIPRTVLKITSALISEFQTLGTLLSIKQIEVNSVPKIIIKYIDKQTLTETTIIR